MFSEGKSNPRIVKIWEKNLPVVKIDLRIQENRDNYHIGNNANENEKFDNYARAFEEVLLVGYVPETHVELLTASDFPSGQFPAMSNDLLQITKSPA